jgi:pSer/pThr/pTyr-binding forkhead associated (FHA) protein
MLIIRHRTGALAGQGQTVEEPSDRVTFGRDPDACDVVFPPDETLISRRHFALERKPSGEWTLDLFGEPFVAVNGTPAEYARAIRTGDVITLGRPGPARPRHGEPDRCANQGGRGQHRPGDA